jgi:hypothetical protein
MLHTDPFFPHGPCLLQATAEFGAFISPSLKDEHGHVVLRLSMGRMIDKLLANMERAKGSNSSSSSGSTGAAVPAAAATSGSTSGSVWGGPGATPRLICYSGHDSTIMPLLTGEHGYLVALASGPECTPPQAGPCTLHVCLLCYVVDMQKTSATHTA